MIKPQDSHWSDEQWQAITEEGKNILVSAGAGSGKTSVLTTRILRHLTEGKSLRNMIVLTFTNAAASNMKDKIARKIAENLNKCPFLQDELDYLDQADIKTFDAYAMGIVKKYGYLEKKDEIIILDKINAQILSEKALDIIFEEAFSNTDFISMLDRLTITDDSLIRDEVINMYKKLCLRANLENYFDAYDSIYYSSDHISLIIKEYISLLSKKRDQLFEIYQEILDEFYDSSTESFFAKLEACLEPLKTAKEISDFSSPIRMPNAPKNVEDLSNRKSKLKEILDDIKEMAIYASIDEMKEEYLATKNDVHVFLKLLQRFHQVYSALKQERNLYSYQDIAHLATHIIEANKEIRDKIKDNTIEILIDEYQDTSDIQEYFINLIANNNLYMVGDIKQTIYRFRNANPEIFAQKFNKYGQKEGGIRIDLMKNFRSRSEVIKDINIMFEKIMCADFGKIEYHDNHELIYGNYTYDDFKIDNYQTEIIAYSDEEIVDEAVLIAKDIKEKMQHITILDKDKKITRQAMYSDFAILPATKNRIVYKQFLEAFDKEGIPLLVYDNQEFVSNDEILVVKNILKCLLEFNEKAYFSILKSFLYQESDNTLLKMKESANYQHEAYSKIEEIKKNLWNYSLSEVLETVYQSFGFFKKIILLSDTKSIEERLLFLLTKAQDAVKLESTLDEFINYIDYAYEKKVDIEYETSQKRNVNAVCLINIHKSKGLEFSYCYYPDLVRRYNFADTNGSYFYDSKYGIILPYYDQGIANTFLKKLYTTCEEEETRAEKMRLLYVAQTRAMEKMIIVGPFLNIEKNTDEKIPYYVRSGFNSFKNIIDSMYGSFGYETKLTTIPESQKQFIALDNASPLDFKMISNDGEEKTYHQSSVEINHLLTEDEKKALKLGTQIHHYLELIDFQKNLEDQIKLIPSLIQSVIRDFFNIPLFQEKIEDVYQEHAFVFERTKGIIDLIIETKEKMIIIDYKTSHIDDEGYKKQIKTYYDYLSQQTTKVVEGYLYSLMQRKLKRVV